MLRCWTAKRHSKELLAQAKHLVREGRFDAAIIKLNTAIQMNPSAHLYDVRGVAQSLAHRNEAAVISFCRAISCSSRLQEQASAYFHRSLLYAREGNSEQALLDSQQAAQLAPHNDTYREARDHFATLRKSEQLVEA